MLWVHCHLCGRRLSFCFGPYPPNHSDLPFPSSLFFSSNLANLPKYSEYFWERTFPYPARYSPRDTRTLLESQLSGLLVIGLFSSACLDVQLSPLIYTHTPHRPFASTYAGPPPPSWSPGVNLSAGVSTCGKKYFLQMYFFIYLPM